MTTSPEDELSAMQRITRILAKLDDEAKRRVVEWVSERYGESE